VEGKLSSHCWSEFGASINNLSLPDSTSWNDTDCSSKGLGSLSIQDLGAHLLRDTLGPLVTGPYEKPIISFLSRGCLQKPFCFCLTLEECGEVVIFSNK
jgi:hypothetical protein